VGSLLEVTAECVRVLKPSGSLWVNLGDKYAGSAAGGTQNGACGTGAVNDGDRKRGHVRTATGIMPQTTVRAKSLIGIPWRYALACIDDLGLILRAEVIWSKPNGLPESVTDRVRRSHETWFHFTLEPRYFSAVDGIREAHQTTGKGSDWQTRKQHLVTRDGYDRQDDVLGFDNAKAAHALGKLPGSVWTVEGGESVTRSVLSAVAAGALTIEEGERILWTGSTSSGQRSTSMTSWTAGGGSASTTDTATGATGRPEKATGAPTGSSTRCQSDRSRAASPSTTSAATAGASTPHTSSQSPAVRTQHASPGESPAPLDMPTTSRTPTSDEMGSESAGDAWPTELESSDDGPPSVWVIPTEPLRVPDHLGIDHFAAFPSEWPKRIIQGWSPDGVCVECGEGRRPVTSEPEKIGGRIRGEVDAMALGVVESDGHGFTAIGARSQYTTSRTISGYACACAEPTADTTPAVVLDVFGGTGTTAMVAKALGRHGITVDMSADYCRLAEWRTNDRDQLAKVLGVAKAEQQPEEQLSMLDLIDGGAA
jgi:DNA modification methylase